ncbi:putative pelota [Schistosoma mansoni]|uniref:putative pelota n=1 Tax=Schistosoma mansoni TaxID=6183 RepID=UPI00022DC404|nr:putative pelota [Schistosoma mansoni]|eukprot:XP_018650595.1 putative pelota [Schistosoma mansoni]
MKVIGRELNKNSSGYITLIAENEEDMWLTYNLVQVGDKMRCSTVRKVQNESATGSVQTKQVRTNLTIEVEKIDFDLQGSVLHLKGRNVVENQFVKMGAYHTLDLRTDEKFTITKTEWDSVAIMLVEQASDPTQQADLAAVIMHEGLAYVCLITSTTTIVRAKIDTTIPRKRPGLPTAQHEKGLSRFFEQIMQALERHIRFDSYKHVKSAADACAIDTLLITDALFRSRNLNERKQYVELVDQVKDNQGIVRIFSSLHVSELNQLSGVAAILRFPIPEPVTDDESNSSEDDDN